MNEEHLDAEAALHLPAAPTSPARARRFISDFCSAARLPAELCETAALLTSELVTNAVVHGRSRATLQIHRPAGTLRVSVRDDDPHLPAVSDQPPTTAENGRGLVIVALLADAWGVEPTDHGKAVWFQLRVSPEP